MKLTRTIKEAVGWPDTNIHILLMWREQIAKHQGIPRLRKRDKIKETE